MKLKIKMQDLIKTECGVIGGGFSGCSVALELAGCWQEG